MQDRYVGDVGDFLKLSILRALSQGRKLGVAWWRHPNEDHNADGRHTAYAGRPADWRALDPAVFDALANIVERDDRRVAALENANLLPGATYANELLPFAGPLAQRVDARAAWFARTKRKLANCDLVFVDPDNGLAPPGYRPKRKTAGKWVTYQELGELAEGGRSLVVYHHQTRRKGGHDQEREHLSDCLRARGFKSVDVLRAKPYSPRLFFLLDASAEMREQAERLASMSGGKLTWWPDTHRPG